MFIAMNWFKVRKGSEHDFKQVWLTRDSHLNPGVHCLSSAERPRA
jgi:heme-degrading monooxygenase HmoA